MTEFATLHRPEAGGSAPPEGQSSNGVKHRAPRCGAPTVAELSARLYAAYQVEGGSVRLAGCTLEPQAIVRAAARCRNCATSPANVESQATSSVAAAAGERAIELFIGPAREQLDEATVFELGLKDLVACDKPPRVTAEELDHLCELGRQALDECCRRSGCVLAKETVTTQIVWCRWAAGKLRFAIGQKIADLAFADWGVRLAPPPLVCPHSGKSTFHLAALDDGRIVAADQIGTCDASGVKMLRSELVTCSVSGKQVSPGLIEICPASGESVLREQFVPCPVCCMQVSPKAIERGRCTACSQTISVTKTDSRMSRILDGLPGLARWRRWRLAETSRSYVLEARGLVRRLLVVIDKQSGEPIRVAQRTRLQSQWKDVARADWPLALAGAADGPGNAKLS